MRYPCLSFSLSICICVLQSCSSQWDANSSGTTVEGGWVSGGGNVIGDSANPWFLNNTSEINVCVQQDRENFNVSEEQINASISQAYKYWQTYFATFEPETILGGGGKEIRLATQTLTISDCHGATDIVIQLGVVNQEQERYLKDTSSIVGISVRTHYDEENLKGKGFIYVSPSVGPRKFSSIEFSEREDFWRELNGVKLTAILTHEFGHIFGIPHIGALNYNIMHRDFPSSLTDGPGNLYAKQAMFTTKSFSGKGKYLGLNTSDAQNLFNMQSSDNYLFLRQADSLFLLFEGGEDLIIKPRLIGQVEFKNGQGFPIPSEFIKLKLSKTQRVFSDKAKTSGDYIHDLWENKTASIFVETVFSSADRRVRKDITLNMDSNGYSFRGQCHSDGKNCMVSFPIDLPSQGVPICQSADSCSFDNQSL